MNWCELMCIINCAYIYLEPTWPVFLKVNPTKQGLFQAKQGSFGFQLYIYRYIYYLFLNHTYSYIYNFWHDTRYIFAYVAYLEETTKKVTSEIPKARLARRCE